MVLSDKPTAATLIDRRKLLFHGTFSVLWLSSILYSRPRCCRCHTVHLSLVVMSAQKVQHSMTSTRPDGFDEQIAFGRDFAACGDNNHAEWRFLPQYWVYEMKVAKRKSRRRIVPSQTSKRIDDRRP